MCLVQRIWTNYQAGRRARSVQAGRTRTGGHFHSRLPHAAMWTLRRRRKHWVDHARGNRYYPSNWQERL